MKFPKLPSQGCDLGVRDAPPAERCTQELIGVELPHLDGRVDDLLRGPFALIAFKPADAGLCRRAQDWNNPEVEVWGKSSVETELLPAIEQAFLKGGGLHEPKTDRFFDLVSEAACEQHPGNVRFNDVHPIDGMGIGLRP